MKKVLLATTMLVAGASVAAAEVTLSGDARMGIISNFGDDRDATNGDEGALNFTSRARVTFTLSGESDSGLSFGASFRADNANGASNGTAGSVFVSGAFGKLTMGDIDGAATAAVGHVDAKSLTGLGDVNESLYIANGGLDTDTVFGTDLPGLTSDPTARYEYTAGGFTGYVSATLPNYVGVDDQGTPATADDQFFEGDAYAVGAKYSTDVFTVSLGYETLEFGEAGVATSLVDLDHVIAGVSTTFSGVTVKANYGQFDGVVDTETVDGKQYAVSATYTMDAISVSAYTNNVKAKVSGVTEIDTRALGIGASYDLGGGASAVAGIANVKDKLANTSDTAFDLGLSFSF